MEYFLLDPSYACRRPALFRYYKEHFGWAPPKQDTCATTYAFLNAGNIRQDATGSDRSGAGV